MSQKPYACMCCGRGLKNGKSREIGMGPVCARKDKKIEKSDGETKYQVAPIPGFGADIVLSRDLANGATANIQQRIVFHSPTGFEWGYAGSGPADLALNILSCFIAQKEAFALHQNFKSDFLVGMPKEGGVITNASVRDWIAAHSRKENAV